MQSKIGEQVEHKFNLVRVIKAHALPITNVAFNKMSSLFCTGSYDRTCKIFETESGREVHTLEGHQNVVYTCCFNNPVGTQIATGSFDKTAKVWCVRTGACLQTLRGHTAEVVAVQFSPDGELIATGSMDTVAKVWRSDGTVLYSFDEHCGEIISISFNQSGTSLLTCSFDHTLAVWSLGTGKREVTLIGHSAEISAGRFNFDGTMIVSGSMDSTMRLWEAKSGTPLGFEINTNFLYKYKFAAIFRQFDDEVLDCTFSLNGKRVAGCSADGVAKVFSVTTKSELGDLEGHDDAEVSRVQFR